MTGRKPSFLALSLTMLVILAGCGESAVTTTASTAAPAATTASAVLAVPAAATAPVSATVGAVAGASGNYPPPIPAGTQVNIVFDSYNLASAGNGKDATQQLIDEFNAAHPNIKVEGRGIPSTELAAKVQAEVVAGTPPDLVQQGFGDLDFTVNSLQAKALEDLVPRDEYTAYVAGEYPLSPNGLKLAGLNGKTYGVPYTFSTPTLFYNADLFKAAGLDPAKPPTTWAEAKQYALAIRDKTGKGGIMVDCLGQFDWCFQGIVRSNGGRVLSEDRTKATFADPEAVEAVKMWQDLVQSGAHPQLSQADAITAFGSGNLGMFLETSALQASLLNTAQGKFTVLAGKMPAFAGKAAVPTNSGSGLFILAKDPLKQRAAWEFMKFVTSEHGYTIITSKIGYLPLRTGIVNDDRYLKPWADAHPLIQPNLEQLKVLEPWVAWPGPNYRQEVDTMMKAVEQVVYSGAPAEATLKTAQDREATLLPKR